jgi:hypothetical protein
MEILKKMSLKLKAAALVMLAGIAVAFVVLRRHVTDGLNGGELDKKEKELQAESDAKLKEEVKQIEEKKEEEILKVEEEKVEKAAELEVKEEAQKKELKKLAKTDRIAFRDQVNKKLGVRQKKTPGRKPRK